MIEIPQVREILESTLEKDYRVATHGDMMLVIERGIWERRLIVKNLMTRMGLSFAAFLVPNFSFVTLFDERVLLGFDTQHSPTHGRIRYEDGTYVFEIRGGTRRCGWRSPFDDARAALHILK